MFRFIPVPSRSRLQTFPASEAWRVFLPSSAVLFLPDINSGIRVPTAGRSDTVIPLYPHADAPELADRRTAMMKTRYRVRTEAHILTVFEAEIDPKNRFVPQSGHKRPLVPKRFWPCRNFVSSSGGHECLTLKISKQ